MEAYPHAAGFLDWGCGFRTKTPALARAFGWVVLWPSVVMSRPRKPEAGPRVSEDFMCDLHMHQLDEETQSASRSASHAASEVGGGGQKLSSPQTSKPLPAPTSLHTVVPKHQTNSSCRCATLKSKPGTPTKTDAPPQSMQMPADDLGCRACLSPAALPPLALLISKSQHAPHPPLAHRVVTAQC